MSAPLPPLEVTPVWNTVTKLWTWTDGVVFYQAKSFRVLRWHIQQGEGRKVAIRIKNAVAAAKGITVEKLNVWYKEPHPQHEQVLDAISHGLPWKQVALDLSIPLADVQRIAARARYHQDPRLRKRKQEDKAA